MAQSIVTRAFEAWNVKKVLDGQPAVPDQIVFALNPNQDENQAVSRDEGMPAAAAIKHRAAITQSGVLNTNAVVYSVVLDTAIGDWDYNWIGLVDSKTQTVLMIVHVRTQQKIKTQNGRQGNSLTRNLAMQFDGAAAATQINVSAATWQIDFSARLFGMDEAHRLSMRDYYGAAAFLNDGFRVSLANSVATIAPGIGYVGGLRARLDTATTLNVSANTSVWVDVSRQGTVTGSWENRITFTAAAALADYTDQAGYAHYVTKLAVIVGGKLTDNRPLSPISELDDRFLPIEGTAIAAKKLATTRKIAGVSFDGTADIALTAENVGIVKQSGPTDATPGAVLINGSWGLGRSVSGPAMRTIIDGNDANAAVSGFHESASNLNWGNEFSPAIVAFRAGGGDGTGQVLQIQASRNGALMSRFRMLNVWTPWATDWNNINLANPMTTDTTQTISGRKTFANGLANEITQDGRLTSLPPIALTDISQLNGMSIGAQIFVNRAASLPSLVPPRVAGDFFCIKCLHKSDIAITNGIFEASQQGLASAKFYGTLSPAGVITWGQALVDGLNAIADANGSWVVPGSVDSVSINDLAGIPLPFPGAVAPAGWLKCNGQSFNKSLYPALASRYPSGVLPDLRGEFVRGWDDLRGADSGRALLSAQSDAMRNITGQFNVVDRQNAVPSGAFAHSSRAGAGISGDFVGVYHSDISFDASKVAPTANENRPRNIAFNYIVRAA